MAKRQCTECNTKIGTLYEGINMVDKRRSGRFCLDCITLLSHIEEIVRVDSEGYEIVEEEMQIVLDSYGNIWKLIL